MKYEYKTISTRSIHGLKLAERLQKQGWRVISSSFTIIVFEREKRA